MRRQVRETAVQARRSRGAKTVVERAIMGLKKSQCMTLWQTGIVCPTMAMISGISRGLSPGTIKSGMGPVSQRLILSVD